MKNLEKKLSDLIDEFNRIMYIETEIITSSEYQNVLKNHKARILKNSLNSVFPEIITFWTEKSLFQLEFDPITKSITIQTCDSNKNIDPEFLDRLWELAKLVAKFNEKEGK